MLQLHAQTYPDRPVKIILPTVAAGTVDLVARVMANDLGAVLGKQFFIENRSGAGNTLGSRDVAHSDPDGYTLLMSSASGQVISPLIYKDPGHDPLKSFAPIAPYAEGSVILVVNPSLPFRSVADLVAYAKANPQKLSYGSAGTGTVPHLTAELFKSAAGVTMVHVPYRGGALSIQDVIAGNLQLTLEASSPMLPHIAGGQLRALAVLSAKRIAELPDVRPSARPVTLACWRRAGPDCSRPPTRGAYKANPKTQKNSREVFTARRGLPRQTANFGMR